MTLLALALLAGTPAGAATLSVAPATARPGDVVLVSVAGGEAAPSGTLAGRPLTFWRAPDGWRALAPLPIETPVGPAAVAVNAGGTLSASIDVVDPAFRTTRLSVAPKFVEPSKQAKRRIAADRKAFAAAFAQTFVPPLFSGAFDWPRRAGTTGRFGDQRTFNDAQPSVHYGLDVDGPVGADVLASNDGTVVLARDCYMSGRSVVVWHGAGVYTVYFHLSRMEVKPGQTVRRGERLGRLGATGRVTGPHLHWSVKVDGLYVDPESLLRIDAVAPSAAAAVATPAPAAAAAQ
jgi:murein DD-endopeptidase MepM/ murein hydrolase activator NlpD